MKVVLILVITFIYIAVGVTITAYADAQDGFDMNIAAVLLWPIILLTVGTVVLGEKVLERIAEVCERLYNKK